MWENWLKEGQEQGDWGEAQSKQGTFSLPLLLGCLLQGKTLPQWAPSLLDPSSYFSSWNTGALAR